MPKTKQGHRSRDALAICYATSTLNTTVDVKKPKRFTGKANFFKKNEFFFFELII